MNTKKEKKIFAFWIGDNNFKEKWIRQFPNNFNVVVGPTKEEHAFLMDASPYYKKSFELNIRSFCSDVWRLYKLSQEDGLYLDMSVKIGPNFSKWFEEISNYSISLFKGNNAYIESGVMFSKNSGRLFFKDMFEIYKSDKLSPLWTEIMPIIMTLEIQKKIKFPFDFNTFVSNDIKLWKLTKIRDKNALIKYSASSWGTNPEKRQSEYEERLKVDRWDEWERSFRNKQISKNNSILATKQLIEQQYIYSYRRMRDSYDISTSKKDLIEIRKVYKKIKKETPFKNKLIWSKLYRFFTFKRAK